MPRHFHQQLELAKVKLLRMIALADTYLDRSIAAFLNFDAPAAAQLVPLDDELDALENELDELCLKILALEQPVAADLRYIVAAMRLVADLERIGDEAKGLAQQTAQITTGEDKTQLACLKDLAALTQTMYRTAVDSFRTADAGLARQVFTMEQDANALYGRVIEEYFAAKNTLPPDAGTALRLIFSARYLERVCDLSTNIAESTVFVLDGISIKHHWPEENGPAPIA